MRATCSIFLYISGFIAGATAIYSVLLETSIFLLLRNGCYVQTTGTPINEGIVAKESMGGNRVRNDEMNMPFARWRVFYSNSYSQHAGLPTKHAIVQLSRARTSESERARALMRHIFRPRKQLYERLIQSAPLFGQITGRYRRFNIGRCLERCCPIRWRLSDSAQLKPRNNAQQTVLRWHAYEDGYESQEDVPAPGETLASATAALRPAARRRGVLEEATLEELLQMDSSHAEVTAFLREFCVQLLPYEIWGSRFNEAVFHRQVAKFVRLRRHEGMCTLDLTAGMRTLDIPWLQSLLQQSGKCKKRKMGDSDRKGGSGGCGDHSLQKQIFSRFVVFVFELIISLLRNSFYVTERESKSAAVAYFRKPVWSSIRRRAQEQCLPQFTPLIENERKLALQHLEGSSLGLSSVRLLPKAKSVRAIANLSKRQRSNSAHSGYMPSTNMTLTSLYHVLKFECSQHPSALGYTVHGLDDVWDRLGSFARGIGSTLPNRFFFASVDLKQCFDMISQDKLFEIASRLLTHETYVLQKSTVVHPLPSSIRRFQVQHTRRVSPPGGLSSFWERTQEIVNTHTRAVVVEGSTGTVVRRQQLIELLREHIFGHLVQISARGVQYFKQHMGIAQGSILSALLCNIYYGTLETSIISPPHSQSACFRLMDDYIFISTGGAQVQHFLGAMDAAHERGDYTLNRDKTRSNMEEDTGWFPWCGIEFNTQDLSVRPGVSKFGNTNPFDLLTVTSPSDRPGEALVSKTCSYMAPKCHPILFDAAINPLKQVYENVLCLALLGAVKSRAHILCLPRKAHPNSTFVFQSVRSTAKYLCLLLLRRVRSHRRRQSFCECSVRRDFVIWLGLRAFVAAFEQKPHASLAPVLSALQAELRQPRYREARRELSHFSAGAASKLLREISMY
jgi:telomerase reverse transcriptase